MRLEGDYHFEARVQEVWSALLDPVVLAAVMPGCEKLELVDGRYVGELNIKVGPVQGKFSGVVELKDVHAPDDYVMVIDGRGAPGFVKASAHVRLTAEGGGTRLSYAADAQVGGKIASIGQRLVDASAKAITKQSLEGLHQNIKLRSAAEGQRGQTAGASGEVPTDTEGPPGLSTPAPAPAPAPVVRADPAAFAASVAREVTTNLVPAPARYGLAVLFGFLLGALTVWLAMRG